MQDSGVGMTSDQLEKVFSEYKQADNQVEQRYGGTGLGLTIAYTLTEKLGGTLHATSEVNSGSCITFYIDPGFHAELEFISSVEERLSRILDPVNANYSEHLSGKVLIVEDIC